MTAVRALLRDLESSLGSTTQNERAVTLSRLTDLFLVTAKGLTEEQIDVFDVVIGRLANAIETRARRDLSERMADVPNAPHGVVRLLAHDEIDIARPVLARSPRLTDEDLVSIAASKGAEHMLAMTARPALSEPVTDFLVLRGDQAVAHAVASNAAAQFSRRGMSHLVMRSEMDEALQTLLGERKDLPEDLTDQLVTLAKDAARRRLSEALPSDKGKAVAGAVESASACLTESADLGGEVSQFGAALAEVHELERENRLDEAAVDAYAAARMVEHVVCAVSILSKLGLAATERALFGPDRDTTLIIGKALGWNWPTVKAILALRPAEEQAIHIMNKSRESFEALAPATAQRVLRFLEIREQGGR